MKWNYCYKNHTIWNIIHNVYKSSMCWNEIWRWNILYKCSCQIFIKNVCTNNCISHNISTQKTCGLCVWHSCIKCSCNNNYFIKNLIFWYCCPIKPYLRYFKYNRGMTESRYFFNNFSNSCVALCLIYETY